MYTQVPSHIRPVKESGQWITWGGQWSLRPRCRRSAKWGHQYGSTTWVTYIWINKAVLRQSVSVSSLNLSLSYLSSFNTYERNKESCIFITKFWGLSFIHSSRLYNTNTHTYTHIHICTHIHTQNTHTHTYTRTQRNTLAQLERTAEYTDCISAEGKTPKDCPGYATKQISWWGSSSSEVLGNVFYMLNWTVFNRTVFLYWNCIIILN